MTDVSNFPDPSALPLFQQPAPAHPDLRAADHLIAAAGGTPRHATPAPVIPLHPAQPAPPAPVFNPPQQPAPQQPPATADNFADEPIDWDIVDVLQRLASERLIDDAAVIPPATARAAMTTVDLEHLERIRAIVDEYVLLNIVRKQGAEHDWSERKRQAYAMSVFNEIYRWGRLQPLLTEPGAKHINIIGHDNIIIRYLDGTYTKKPAIARNNDELMGVLQNLSSKKGGRDFSEIKRSVGFDLRGARLNVLASSVANVPSIAIRVHNYVDVDFTNLIGLNTINARGAGLLAAAVLAKRNILISGSPGAGKTTLLRACASAIPYEELFATVETEYELYLHELTHRHMGVIPVQMVEGNSEGVGGEFSLRDGIKALVRQNVQRFIVGEVRGSEVHAMMEAMQVGGGALSTIHAESSDDAIFRLSNLMIQEGSLTNDYYPMRLIEQHIRIIVQIREIRDRNGRPRHVVTEIAEVLPPIGDQSRPRADALFRFDRDADELVFTGTQPSPALMDMLVEEGGLNPSFFTREGSQ